MELFAQAFQFKADISTRHCYVRHSILILFSRFSTNPKMLWSHSLFVKITGNMRRAISERRTFSELDNAAEAMERQQKMWHAGKEKDELEQQQAENK